MTALERLLDIPRYDEAHAYAMGADCARNGANTTNCHFALFSSPSMTRAWESGKREAEREMKP